MLNLIFFAVTATAAALQPRFLPPANTTGMYDAIVVGGGPAGLAALSSLARVHRNALLIDSGEYRNGVTRHVHDVLGFDGVTPAYYRWAARELISDYPTAHMENGTVTKIVADDDSNASFTVSITNSTLPKTLQARKIIIATGVSDIIPNTPGLLESWGQGLYWCPWCDGNEHFDEPLGLMGPLSFAATGTREISTLNTDVIAFVNGTWTPDNEVAATAAFPGWKEYLDLHNVTIDNRTIASIEHLVNASDSPGPPGDATYPEHDLFRLNFDEGESVERAAFYVEFKNKQHSDIGADMGINLLGGRLQANATKGYITNLFGVYAIGDANSDNITNVYHALTTGKSAAVYAHVQIAREDEQLLFNDAGYNITVPPSKRDEQYDIRSLWGEMNGHPRDVMYVEETPF